MSRAPSPFDAPTLGAVAVGGAIGASIRFVLSAIWPGPAAILVINVLGCLLMGVLLAVTARAAHRLTRPFIGTGMLGGFTTVSTFAVLSDGMLARSVPAGVLYAVGTAVLAVLAAGVGTSLGRRVSA